MTINHFAAFAASAALIAGAATASDGGRKLQTTLSGAAEVPGPGDTDGTGKAAITVNAGQNKVCYKLSVANIAVATMAHIHEGAPTVAGPVKVTLGKPNASGMSSGCVTVARSLALAILKRPADYYVNVHNAEFPSGAVRGQLGK
ncbi:MAG: CHRD domain-containing protein [Sphingomicrobium sp.]